MAEQIPAELASQLMLGDSASYRVMSLNDTTDMRRIQEEQLNLRRARCAVVVKHLLVPSLCVRSYRFELMNDLIPTLITIAVVLGAILTGCMYLVLAERKVSAWMQDRIGPNRVGPFGLFQPMADGLKILLKEGIIPSHVDKWLFIDRAGDLRCSRRCWRLPSCRLGRWSKQPSLAAVYHRAECRYWASCSSSPWAASRFTA